MYSPCKEDNTTIASQRSMVKLLLYLMATEYHLQKTYVARLRQAKGQAGVAVTFTEDMKLTMKKENFLANSDNKQHFIKMLSSYLETKCIIYHAQAGFSDCIENIRISCINGYCTNW